MGIELWSSMNDNNDFVSGTLNHLPIRLIPGSEYNDFLPISIRGVSFYYAVKMCLQELGIELESSSEPLLLTLGQTDGTIFSRCSFVASKYASKLVAQFVNSLGEDEVYYEFFKNYYLTQGLTSFFSV